MHNNIELILTLTTGLIAALTLGFLALRIKLPPIVGYLLAGLLVGPYTPGFVADREIAEQLAEVGVILLMFGVGLHFHLKDLMAVRGIAVTGALFQIAVATALGALATHALGWSWQAGVVFGIALSVASTVVLTRVLADNRDLQSRAGRIAIGWLVVEDLFTVFVLVLLPALFGGAAETTSAPLALGVAALKLVALTVLTLGPGGRIIPRLLASAARTNSRELFTLTVLAIALGIAVGSAELFGVSMALGAFLAGMVVGQSEFSFRAAAEALPMRDAFAVLFFVSVGMLFDPQQLVRAPGLILITTGIVLFGKPIAALLIVLVLGYGARIGLRVAVALAQIGEFSFILAVLGDQLRILPDGATNALVVASILTITLNPLLYRAVPSMERVLMRSRLLRGMLRPAAGMSHAGVLVQGAQAGGEYGRAIVVGYGPVGQSVARLLIDRGITPTIIELNLDTVRRLQSSGIPVIYGDAGDADILVQAGLSEAVALILSAPGSPESAELIRRAREINPSVQVLARSAFLSQASALRNAGADQVFSGEAEVAMAIIDAMLRRLGATPEQMDSERDRARTELYRLGGLDRPAARGSRHDAEGSRGL